MIYFSLKDTPDGGKAGTKYLLDRDNKYHAMNVFNHKGWTPLERSIVEDNPQWFQKKEMLKIEDFGYIDGTDIPENLRGFHFKTSGIVISPENYKDVVKAIERLFNY